jgi:hypothetical protein
MKKKMSNLSIGDTVLLPFDTKGCFILHNKHASFYREATLTKIKEYEYLFGLNNINGVKYFAIENIGINNKFSYSKIIAKRDAELSEVEVIDKTYHNLIMSLATGLVISSIFKNKKEMINNL